MDENRDQYQWVYYTGINHLIKTFADCFYRSRSFIWWQGGKAHNLRPVCFCLSNHILRILKPPSDILSGVFVQITMQLENVGRTDRNILITFVNGIKHIPIPHNFFLITVSRGCFILAKLLHPGARSYDAFNLIRCLCALYFCNFYQFVERSWFLLQI